MNIAGVQYDLVQYINYNKLEQKTNKKLFTPSIDMTPLFGYRHYIGLTNGYDSRVSWILQEKMLAESTQHNIEDKQSDVDTDESDEEITDSTLLCVYQKHRNSGRAGNTPWKTIVAALDYKITVRRLKTRVNKQVEAAPKTHTVKNP